MFMRPFLFCTFSAICYILTTNESQPFSILPLESYGEKNSKNSSQIHIEIEIVFFIEFHDWNSLFDMVKFDLILQLNWIDYK